jgi:hypothetical protein
MDSHLESSLCFEEFCEKILRVGMAKRAIQKRLEEAKLAVKVSGAADTNAVETPVPAPTPTDKKGSVPSTPKLGLKAKAALDAVKLAVVQEKKEEKKDAKKDTKKEEKKDGKKDVKKEDKKDSKNDKNSKDPKGKKKDDKKTARAGAVTTGSPSARTAQLLSGARVDDNSPFAFLNKKYLLNRSQSVGETEIKETMALIEKEQAEKDQARRKSIMLDEQAPAAAAAAAPVAPAKKPTGRRVRGSLVSGLCST